ncbi:hypothetical protein DBZ36_11170 [Alginatibacterium sediminis]|uniref:Uncharacterized protein n=1 Tax=Alginatibacterium sediminis TaxID=2164068 RepID=A0A420EAY4_9ALTE|nr:NAD-binding protein [Alginatibacterium sediminis]RKF17814.1 hypothetical protein DBZ36_11170 [Alginatibacterium sediminis]
MQTNILIVGAGQLGSRHLQALASLNESFDIYVVDPSTASLSTAEQRYLEVKHEHSPIVHYEQTIHSLSIKTFKVAIIASNADIRFEIIRTISEQLELEFLLLEKVLFQSTEQLINAQEIISKAGITTWVNCPRRLFTAYQQLALRYQGCSSISIEVDGSNWGLACNAIHFLDLWHQFAGFTSYQIDYEPDTKVVSSKRPGYQELVGSLNASSNDGKHRLKLTCNLTEDKVPSLSIKACFDEQVVEFLESEGQIRWLDECGEIESTIPLQILYQSQTTDKVVLSMIETGRCQLTTLTDSAMLHREFLDKTCKQFTSQTGIEHKIAPIT